MATAVTMVKDRELRDTRPERVRPPMPVHESGPEPVCSADDQHGQTDRYRCVRPLFSLDELQGSSQG